MQSVREFDQYHPDIFCNRDKQLTMIFRLLFLLGTILHLLKLSHSVDYDCNFHVEHLNEVIVRIYRILDNIMQKAGNDRRSIQFQLSQNTCNLDWMKYVWQSTFSKLSFMCLERQTVCFFNHTLVTGRQISFTHFENIIFSIMIFSTQLFTTFNNKIDRPIILQFIGQRNDTTKKSLI